MLLGLKNPERKMRRQSVLRGVDAMKAAFYEKDITPPLGDFLVGSYCRWFAEDVLDPLFVRAAVIESNGMSLQTRKKPKRCFLISMS